jgi:hypothetical protein
MLGADSVDETLQAVLKSRLPKARSGARKAKVKGA